MLFSKKKVYAIGEKVYKEHLKDKEQEVLVIINLRLPQIQCPKKDPLLKKAVPFYEKLGEGFFEFAKTQLFETATLSKKSQNQDFKPFGAISYYEITEDNSDYLSVLIDFSVSDGMSPPISQRKTQVWNKKTGSLCKITDFINKKQVENTIGKENIRKWQKDLFLLCDGKIKTFIRDKDNLTEILLTAETEIA